MLDPLYILVTANFGGHNAKWAYEHLEEKVLYFQPNAVTLWWGFDDMGGCPGIFDRDTNKLVGYKVDAIVTEHVRYLRLLIDALHEHNIPVFVMTPIPALQGQLPWSHLDEKNNIVWEEGRWCNFNQGLQLLVQAQKDLVAQYASLGKPVYLVDVWQIYLDHPDTEKMYMDVVHPASNGVQLIAERWLEVFEATR
jgi:lysophospholipase L1-like esterase